MDNRHSRSQLMVQDFHEYKLNCENETEVHYSCGATLNGQHWIIGGENEKRQVSD